MTKLSSQIKWDRAHPKERWAQRSLHAAIRAGLIERGPCEVCGVIHGIDGAIVDGHHDSYDLPMAVRWLCRLHHRKWHRGQIACEAVTEAGQ